MDQQSPESLGDNTLPPISLTPEQENLCERLDNWYSQYNIMVRPSDIFRGAIFAARTECRSNPDWIAQATHSLRDILYPFWGGNDGVPKKEEALKGYGSVKANGKLTQEIGRIYGSLTELAHHGNGRGNSIDFLNFKISDFANIVSDFERAMIDALMRQLDVHNEIDKILSQSPT